MFITHVRRDLSIVINKCLYLRSYKMSLNYNITLPYALRVNFLFTCCQYFNLCLRNPSSHLKHFSLPLSRSPTPYFPKNTLTYIKNFNIIRFKNKLMDGDYILFTQFLVFVYPSTTHIHLNSLNSNGLTSMLSFNGSASTLV